MAKKDPSHDRLIRQRIRNRREARGMAAYELAKRADISPSYMSLIENGTKLPSEEIAIRIAEALDDDADLYRAWVQASRYPNLAAHVERMLRLERVGSTPELRARVRSGEGLEEATLADLEESASPRARRGSASERMKRWARRAVGKGAQPLDLMASEDEALSAEPEPQTAAALESMSVMDIRPAPTVEVPLLADGADPGEDPTEADDVIEWLHVDSRFLPPDIEQPFAYRPDEAAVTRVRGAIRPGDVVVLAARPLSVDPSEVYAVRCKGDVVLSRVVRHGTVLLLLPPEEGGRPVPIESRNEQQLFDRLAGVVVTTIRSWDSPRSAEEPAPRPEPRGWSVRLEGDFLVRDCHWKTNYGWRPQQRPEDLDYLEAHPGTRIRFRLIKDDRVRYLLEMSPKEWRRALGSYLHGLNWRKHGYIVAITRRQSGEYSTEFQDRWSPHVREAEGAESDV